MKKRLLLLPLLASFALTGCELELFGMKIFGDDESSQKADEKEKEEQKEEEKKEEEQEEEEEEEEQVTPPYIKEEFGDYKLAKEIKNGGTYIIGIYRQKEKKMRFFNGKYHHDKKGDYPYYAGTDEESTANAAQVTVNFVNAEEFTLHVSSPDNPWDNKYIGVYASTSQYDNAVCSLALFDDPAQTSYDAPIKDGHGKQDIGKTDITAKFKYHAKIKEVDVYAPAFNFKYPGEASPTPKFMGTGHANSGADYTSMDSKPAEVALNGDLYDLAHLYELKA